VSGQHSCSVVGQITGRSPIPSRSSGAGLRWPRRTRHGRERWAWS